MPRCVDGAEMAVRAVLGQQVSTAAARTHAARLVARARRTGERTPAAGSPTCSRSPMPWCGARRLAPCRPPATLAALVGALSDRTCHLGPGCDRDEALAVLAAMPGIGPWTAQMIAMRALGDPDAFPASDLGVRRAAAGPGHPATPAALSQHARAWRPWRAYAVQYLWAAADHPDQPLATGRCRVAPRVPINQRSRMTTTRSPPP